METLLRAGLSNAVTATVLALLVAGLSRPLARRPAILHGLWLLVLLKLVTPPIFELAVPWPIAGSPAPAELAEIRIESDDAMLAGRASVPDDLAWTERPGEEISDIRLSPAPETPGHVLPLDWRLCTGTAWVTGTLVLLAVSALRIRRFHGLLRSASPATGEEREWVEGLATVMELRRVPDVFWVRARLSPLVWSLGLRPRLILPQALWKTLDEHQRSTLVVHELAHLKRGDHLVRFLELVVTALYWWHPLLWWIRQSLRDAEEQCCDAWVVWAFPESAKAYAETLLDTLDFVHRSDQPEPLLASGLGKVPHLRRRLTMIMTGTTIRAVGVRGTLGLLAFAGMMLPVGATWAQEPKEPKEPKELKIVVRTDEERTDPDDIIRFIADASGDEPSLERKVVILRADGPKKTSDELFLNGPIDDVVKKLQARIHELENELKEHPDAADGAKAQIKHLMGALGELKKARHQGAHDVSVRFRMNDGPGGENAAAINKMRQHVFELRKAMEAKLTELQAVQAKIRELGGDAGDIPVVEWRRTLKKGQMEKHTTYTVVRPPHYVTYTPLGDARDAKVHAVDLKRVRIEKRAEVGKAKPSSEPQVRIQVRDVQEKPHAVESGDQARLESLEKRLNALQDEVHRLKKGSGSEKNNP